jgi:hypothetical protein
MHFVDYYLIVATYLRSYLLEAVDSWVWLLWRVSNWS